MPDDDVIDRLIKSGTSRRTETGSAADGKARLPLWSDDYVAAASPDSNEVSRLVLVMGKDGFKAGASAYHFLQYVHIGFGDFGFWDDGHHFTFLWNEMVPKLVVVRGRNLLKIADYISLRRLAWIRQADRDFRGFSGVPENEPIITRIEITDWKPPKK